MNYLARSYHRRGWRFAVIGLVTASVVILMIGAYVAWRPEAGELSVKATSIQSETPDSLSSRLLIVGDVFWGRYMQRKAEASPQKEAFITKGLSAQDRSSYEAWIGNFECPVTAQDIPYDQQVGSLRFNCRPEYLPNLAKWFTAASLANNHTDNNNGQSGVLQTRLNLEQAGIQYFGNYDMTKLGDICEVVTVPAQASTSKTLVGMPVALCGYMYVVNTRPSDEQLAVMQHYSKVMPVIALPHMGIEYRSVAEAEKIAAYHRMIDNGADVVVGAHPHVIQNTEAYKGKLIAYSVGNFLFDQQSVSRATTIGLGVGISFSIKDTKAIRIYSEVAKECRTYKDNCLNLLSARLSNRPSMQVSYTFPCYDESSAVGGVPHLGSPAVCQEANRAATTDNLVDLAPIW